MEQTPHIPQRLFGDFTGQLSPAYAREDFIALLGDSFYPEKMTLLHDGRNKLYRLDLRWHGVVLPLAVKRFGRSNPVKEFSARWKGGKARRSWQAATARYRCGLLGMADQPGPAGVRWLARPWHALARRWISAGSGCDSDLEPERSPGATAG